MLQRTSLVVALLGLVVVCGGTQDAGAGANDPAWIVAANATADGSWPAAGFQGLPDLNRASAKFLVMNGEIPETNQSLEGVFAGRHTVRLSFPAGSPNIQVALFDANTTGFWDQRPDGVILRFPPRVLYELYADPDGTTASTIAAPGYSSADPANAAFVAQRRILSIDSNDASLAGSDNKWCALYDQPFNSALHAGGLDLDGDVNVVFQARIIPAIDLNPGDAPGSPGTFLQGTERVGYKLAFNGTYILPGGSVIGFGGGAIDERYPVGAGDNSSTFLKSETLDPWIDPVTKLPSPIPGTEVTNQFDGVFEFLVHNTHACDGDIPFNEADADWDAAPAIQKTLGVPPDNGQPHNITIPSESSKFPPNYVVPVFPLHDNTDFAVGNPIEWLFYAPNPGNLNPTDPGFAALNLPFWSSNNIPNRQPMPIGWLDHASVNVFQQDLVFVDPTYGGTFANIAAATAGPNPPLLQDPAPGGPGTTPAGPCWQAANFAQATVLGQQGLWRLRWQGVDASNFVFIRFGTDVGSTPRKVKLQGRLFCDDNNNNVFDSTETVVSGGTPPGTLWNIQIQKVDAANAPLPGAPVVTTPVNASGSWGPVPLKEARYSITAVPSPGATEQPRGPIFLDVVGVLPDCTVEQDVPVDCRKATVCGIVYCTETWTENEPVPPYNLLTDTPLNGATVTLTGPAPSTATQTFITGTTLDNMGMPLGDGRYCFYDLVPGVYTITITSPPAPPPGQVFVAGTGPSPVSRQVTIQGAETIPNQDFGYCCEVPECKIKGNIWCDDDMDNVRDPNEPGLSVGYSVVITDVNNPATTFSPPIDANGMYMQLVPPGTYTVDLFYLGTKNFPPNVQVQGGDQRTVTCPAPVPGVPQPDLIADFPVKCLGEICGWVFCQRDICDGVRRPGDVPLNGAVVTLTGPLGPMSTTQTFTTGVTVDPVTNGTLPDGRYCFRNLIPGAYTIAITTPPAPPPGEIFVGPPPAPINVTVGAFQQLDEQNFAYCCKPTPTDICVCVFCDEDCDGQQGPGEVTGIAGVKYTLLDSAGNVVGMHTSTVGPNGEIQEFCFTSVPRGNYTVRVDVVPAGLTPSTPQTVQVVAGAAPAKVVFGYCKPGEICGKVWLDGKNEKGDCDGVFQEEYDECLDGLTVELLDASGAVVATTTTGSDGADGVPPFTGEYCFRNLKPGTYTVRLPAPFNLTRRITLASNQSVDVGVVSQQTSTVDFYFTAQSICGKVWCEPSEEDCDGEFVAGVDTPIAGLEMLLTGTGGDALGLVETAITDANGDFCFDDVPTGTYELQVSDNPLNAPLLEGKIAQGSAVRTLTVDLCDCPKEYFYYCPCDQDICVKVFKERGKDCDGEFDEGVDVCLEWVEVFVTHKGNNQTYLLNGWTDEDGKFCFKGLPPGEYWVYVGANQDRLYGLKPCDYNPKHPCPVATVVLEPCKDEYVQFCFCEPCPKKPCCEGKLHEVVVDTKIWVGDCVSDHWGASAHLQISCKKGAGVYGEAWGDWYGAFPGAIKGLDGVVTIEDVWYSDGIATVRVRLKATGPELEGWFPNRKLRLTVFVNGKKETACIKLRCETMRPGAVFPWTKKCLPQPECEEPEKAVFKRYSAWRWCDCLAPFFVRTATSYESWRACHPCEPEKKHKDVVVKYTCDDCVEDHTYMVKLKDGREVMDQIKIEFWGNEWVGPRRGGNGHLDLVKVWRGEHGAWYAKLRIWYKCGCDYHPPEWLKLWSKIDSCAKDKRVYLECDAPRPVLKD